MTSESIKVPCPHRTVTFLCALIVSTLIKNVVAPQTAKKYKEMEILDDLPLKTDIEKYLITLEKIYRFADKYKHYVDLNLSFGMFLANVNLRTIYLLRGVKLPTKAKNLTFNVIKKSDEILKFFHDMVIKSAEEIVEAHPVRKIAEQVFESEITWAKHLQKFRTNLINATKFYSKRELRVMYSDWSKYFQKVNDFSHYSPSPQFSDFCLGSLLSSPVNHKMKWQKCDVNPSCIKLILNGSDYGYGITHRLLFLITARYARGCSVTSGSQDKNNIDKLCSKIYSETEYLSHNNFDVPDLAMEQMALCSLEGHEQFLRRSWLEDLLEFQNVIGCFGGSLKYKDIKPVEDIETPKWIILRSDQEILGGLCNSHTTGVAAATLAATVRYIIEKFY